MDIREATEEDLAAVLEVHRQAFGSEVEPELTRILPADPAAQPLISLLAEEEGTCSCVPHGHMWPPSTQERGE